MAYLNFVVELAALPDGRYRVQVQVGESGASADVASPFNETELAFWMAVLSREQRVSADEESKVARAFGEQLFHFLIHASDDTSRAYFSALERAEREGYQGVRLRLAVERAGLLAQLPWELLYDPQRYFIAKDRRTPIVRFRRMLSLRTPIPVALPLRVLVMVAAPRIIVVDGEVRPVAALDADGEWSRLQAATRSLQTRGLISLERLDDATLPALRAKLRPGHYHVFHFIGHSDMDAGGRGVLLFEGIDDATRADVIDGAVLAQELAQEDTLRLVILNSCHSARRLNDDPFDGVSSSLVAQGVPAVVAMQFAITDRAATAFSEEFYKALADFLPVEAAVSEARRAITDYARNSEWATPVLYMRADDGVLFKRPIARPPLPVLAGALAAIVVALVLIGLLLARRADDDRAAATATAIASTATREAVVAGTVTAIASIPTATAPPPLGQSDLQIVGTMRLSPSRPAPGQIFFLNFSVRNAGIADSGAFNIVWDASLAPPIQVNSHVQRVDNIPPNSTKSISFPFSYGWWGEYSTFLTVDIDAEINDIDRRNNRQAFQITVADQPMEVDFTRLPDNTIVEAPQAINADAYEGWNLRLGVVNANLPACADAGLLLDDPGDGDPALSLNPAALEPECADLPISIAVTRRVVGRMTAEILPTASGTATITYYSDLAGTRVLAQPFTVTTIEGEPIELNAGAAVISGIRRIDVRTPGQRVLITRVTLAS